MRSPLPALPRRTVIAACAAIAVGVSLIVSYVIWPQPYRVAVFGGMVFAAILSAILESQRSSAEDRPTAPSLVIDFGTLLCLGPSAMVYVATVGTITQALARSHLSLRLLLQGSTTVLAAFAAGQAHAALGGSLDGLRWPLPGLSIGSAVIAYGLVKSVSANVIVPFSNGRSLDPSWLKNAIDDSSSSFIVAGILLAFVETINRRAWEVLTVAIVPLYYAYRAYGRQLQMLDGQHRRRDVIESMDQGMCAVDNGGRIALWNQALARLVACPRELALGRSLSGAIPTLNQTALLAALNDTLEDRKPRTLADLTINLAAGARIVQVKILPGIDDVTLLWLDVTEQTHSRLALTRSQERLALAAEGANDGLWEWSLQNHEFYFSTRWAEMIGIAPSENAARPEQWLDRVHADDIAPLQEALHAHLSGREPRLQLEHRIRHEDGSFRWFLCRAVAAYGVDQSPVRIAGSLTDISEQARAQERLRAAASRDPLTGLWNRTVFVEDLGRRLNDLKQWRSGRFAVLYLDLDRFKLVNDSLGHLVGDELLTAASRRIETCLRKGDALARLGGDEFAILLSSLDDFGQANAIAFRIQTSLNAPFSIGGREVFTSASIGIAFSRADYANPEEMMRDADTAMYHAKAHGRARHELFDAEMHAEAVDRLGLESDLRHAVKSNDFNVYYQPIVSLSSRRCVGFESLIRWQRNGEFISPAKFIPVAEELGLIETLGTWVLQQACRTFADWQRRFPSARLECITVNVSTRQLMQQHFVHVVEQAVSGAGLQPCDLRLEITETALMENPRHAGDLLKRLREYGVKIYLDDFGTGHSSLSHLAKLPVDALKIDRSFVRSLLQHDRPAIVESILALARTLDTGVVAEGVESHEQARELERLDCQHAQGFYFSPPLPAHAVEELLIANRPLGEDAFRFGTQAAWKGKVVTMSGLSRTGS